MDEKEVTNQVEENQEEQVQAPDIASLLSNFPGAPTTNQVEGWKTQVGEVFCSAMSEEEIFIWKALSRKEFVDLQLQAQQDGWNNFQLEEGLVRACLLWASEKGLKSLDVKAGSLSTLNEQVMQNSNFMSPSLASALVIKL